jgi:RecB family endonuclease NucS
MWLFSITSEETFKEYVETDFQAEYREAVLEDWLEPNRHCIVEDGTLFIIGRQVTTNLGSSIDLLAVDRQGAIAVIELKRDRTPRETLAQALEYASFAELLDYEQPESIYQTYTGE